MSKFEEIFFTIRVVLLLISLTYSEILKAEDTTHIYCIDNDDNDSTLNISPPLEKIQSNSDLLKDVVWDNDDWTLESSTEIPIAAVIDKRWEDFTLVKTDYHYFNISNSRSVSVLSPAIVEIFARNDDNGIYKLVELNDDDGWHHFSVILKNNQVLFYQNNIIVTSETDFGYTDVIFRSRSTTYWKVHEYNLRWSDTVTKDPTIVKIPTTGKSCVLLYTSLCGNCTLNVISNDTIKTFRSEYEEMTEVEYHWETMKIKIEPDRENDILIYKEHHGNGNGFWAIDFGLCDSENIVSYRKPSESITTNYTCSSLYNYHHKNNEILTTDSVIIPRVSAFGNDRIVIFIRLFPSVVLIFSFGIHLYLRKGHCDNSNNV